MLLWDHSLTTVIQFGGGGLWRIMWWKSKTTSSTSEISGFFEMGVLSLTLLHHIIYLLECRNSEVTSKRLKKGAWMIWHAIIWMIWKERNVRIFNNQVKEVDEIVDEIKAVSWFWALCRFKIVSFLFYEWTWSLGILESV